jgi:GNAT superfamily N-acetyltransferase
VTAPAAGERARIAVDGGGYPLIRSLDPRDAHHLADLFGRLSPTSRHFRYLAPMSTLPAGHLRHLAAVDHQAHEAVGAFEAGELVGVAHYFRSSEESTQAEIAVEVADVHQQHGLGRRLLAELARLARDRGITHFTAIALAENPGVRGMLQQPRWPTTTHTHGTEIVLRMRLLPPEACFPWHPVEQAS